MDKIVNINKPIGITSNRALTLFKKQYGIKKCGHAGSLDPFASGVLLIATNKATKKIKYICKSDFNHNYQTCTNKKPQF